MKQIALEGPAQRVEMPGVWEHCQIGIREAASEVPGISRGQELVLGALVDQCPSMDIPEPEAPVSHLREQVAQELVGGLEIARRAVWRVHIVSLFYYFFLPAGVGYDLGRVAKLGASTTRGATGGKRVTRTARNPPCNLHPRPCLGTGAEGRP